MSLGLFPTDDSPAVVRWIAGLVALLAALFCILGLLVIVHSLTTGTATYHYGPRGLLSEKVTRTTEPGKYHEALMKQTFQTGVSGVFAFVCFAFFRKLGE